MTGTTFEPNILKTCYKEVKSTIVEFWPQITQAAVD